MNQLKFFDLDENDILSFKGKNSFYWFSVSELGRPLKDDFHFIIHLSCKNWVGEHHITELIDFAKKRFPDMDFSEIEKIAFIQLKDNKTT